MSRGMRCSVPFPISSNAFILPQMIFSLKNSHKKLTFIYLFIGKWYLLSRNEKVLQALFGMKFRLMERNALP